MKDKGKTRLAEACSKMHGGSSTCLLLLQTLVHQSEYPTLSLTEQSASLGVPNHIV